MGRAYIHYTTIVYNDGRRERYICESTFPEDFKPSNIRYALNDNNGNSCAIFEDYFEIPSIEEIRKEIIKEMTAKSISEILEKYC